MTNEKKIKPHSPLPLSHRDMVDTEGNNPIYSAQGNIVAEVFTNQSQLAEFIVRACNSHYALVEALKECITEEGAASLASKRHDYAWKRLMAITYIAEQALALAEGKE